MSLRKKKGLEDSQCLRVNQEYRSKTNIFSRKKKSNTHTSRWRPSKARLPSYTLTSSATQETDMKILEEQVVPILLTRGHGQEQDRLQGQAGRQGMEVEVHSMGLNEMNISKSAKAPNLKAINKQLTPSLNQGLFNLCRKLAHMVSHNQNGKLDWGACSVNSFNLRPFSNQSMRASNQQSRRSSSNIGKQEEEHMSFKDHPKERSRQRSIIRSMPERLKGNPSYWSSRTALLSDVPQTTNMLDQTLSTKELNQPWSTTPLVPTGNNRSESPETNNSKSGSHLASLQPSKSPSASWRLSWMASTSKKSKSSKTTSHSSSYSNLASSSTWATTPNNDYSSKFKNRFWLRSPKEIEKVFEIEIESNKKIHLY